MKVEPLYSTFATLLANPDFLAGPNGGGIDPFGRILYTDDTLDIEDNLHELVHVICALPFVGDDGVEDVPEESLLFMYERALAEACLDESDLKRVIDYQLMTHLTRYEADLGTMVHESPASVYGLWTTGLSRCRKVGLLDEHNFPTFRWPDWSRLTPQQVASMTDSRPRWQARLHAGRDRPF